MARTITNPANNSALSSSIIRTELQTLETEVADTTSGHTHNGSDSRTIAITNLTGTLLPSHGGTGIANNAASTLTITGSFATTFTITGATSLTLPTSGTVTALGNATTGSGSIVLASSPALTTPSLGVATATSVNGLAITTSTGTFTLTNGKTLSVTNTLTLSGTDSTVMTFPSTTATIARTDAAQTFTGIQTFATIAAATNSSVSMASGTYNTIQSYSPGAGGTATLDLSKGNIHHITMPAGNITIALSNGTTGQCFVVRILQDSVGSRTVTWFTTIKWAGGAPTLTVTANKADCFGFEVTGSNTYDGFIVGQNI